ncbi:transporter [Salinibacterium sp. M195]|nr:transporter [Salinibacterium sp. M195]
MSAVGLLYVGAVLFLNGLALMGIVKGAGATPLNWFVGFLQVLTPTYLIFTAGGDAAVIFSASGLYLFGFTYLYVAMGNTWGYDPTGLGYFSLFVAIAAVAYAVANLVWFGDYAFFVIWLQWAVLWSLFYLVLGKGMTSLTWITGAVAAVQGWITAAIPAFLILTGIWQTLDGAIVAIVLAVVFIVAMVILRTRQPAPAEEVAHSNA